jgi:hypothetical protein
VIKSCSQKRTLFDLQESVRQLLGATDAMRARVVLQLVAFTFFRNQHSFRDRHQTRVSGSAKRLYSSKTIAMGMSRLRLISAV